MPNDFDLDDLDEDDDNTNGMTEAQLVKQAQETGDAQPLVKYLRGVIKDSAKEKKTLRQQVEAASEATKKLAFIEAKLPDNPQVKFFLDHYEGDFSAEAIRTAAASNGFIAAETNEQHEEMGEVERMMEANRGASQTAAPGTDAELMERIAAVPPGDNAAKQIAQIMQAAGRYTDES